MTVRETLHANRQLIKDWMKMRPKPKHTSGWAEAYEIPNMKIHPIIKQTTHKRETVARILQVVTDTATVENTMKK